MLDAGIVDGNVDAAAPKRRGRIETAPSGRIRSAAVEGDFDAGLDGGPGTASIAAAAEAVGDDVRALGRASARATANRCRWSIR